MTTTYLPYAGIGSRETPQGILGEFTEIGQVLADHGFTLRSGGAEGADTAFEIGVDSTRKVGLKEIYIPWKGFNKSKSDLYGWLNADLAYEALRIAEQYHPAWDRCSEGARKMHARNVAQVLGSNLNQPSLFVVCWTKNGLGGGGTGQALRIARGHGIPIFDLGGPDPENTKMQLSEYASGIFNRSL